ncbi:MAG: acyltransferase [Lachnospiraceae bacterium]|jgi:peptidoglycan/LPS O-acetylase OafA/YrhL|nr:acyltransferase [Lachnospiraceae bacterium]
MNQTQIYSFKIFKILSCFGVVLVHYGQITHLNGSIKILTDFGAYGVYMFFIISGFLGYLSYSHSHSCRQYYLKRIFRILPLYYAIIIYNIVLYELLLSSRFEVPADSSHLGWLRYFLLLSQTIPSSDNFWINLSATWTISHFMFFYLLMPLLFKYVNTCYKALILQLCCFILNYFWNSNYFLPLTSLYYFIIGISIYLALKEHKENFVIAISCLMNIPLLLFNYAPEYVYSNIFMILIIVSRNFYITSQPIDKLIRLLDEYSFTVYLVHAVIIEAMVLMNDTCSLSPLQISIILIVGTAFISILLHHLIEKPISKFIQHKINAV